MHTLPCNKALKAYNPLHLLFALNEVQKPRRGRRGLDVDVGECEDELHRGQLARCWLASDRAY